VDLLIRGRREPDDEGHVQFITPDRAGWTYVGFAAVRLGARETRAWKLDGSEACVVLIGGHCVLRAHATTLDATDGRASPFDGPPHVLYVPPGVEFSAEALDGVVDLAIGSAPASGTGVVRGFAPGDARLEMRGTGNMERRIHHLLMEDRDAERLLVTEVITPAGHWSSYPPHKHDTDDPPRETCLEEVYYYRLRDPLRGFALQRVYTADRSLDESVAARDGDVVLVPRGFHTVSAPPGYEVYYLNVMAGPRREWKVTFDPDHERLRG
jgi:5-deoxy-glucuronate isomerase